MLERWNEKKKQDSNKNNTTRGNISEGTCKRRKSKEISRQDKVKEIRQDILKQQKLLESRG